MNQPIKNLTVKAAAIMGVTPQFLRVALQQGRFAKFGAAARMKKWGYYINADGFYAYMRGKEDAA